MGTVARDLEGNEEYTLVVDDRGRVTLPKRMRDRLGIESNDKLSVSLRGSVLEITPQSRAKLNPATAGRDDWTASTPLDAGEALFGSPET